MWCFELEFLKNISLIVDAKMASTFNYYSLADLSTVNKACISVPLVIIRMDDWRIPSEPNEFAKLPRNCVCIQSAGKILAKL